MRRCIHKKVHYLTFDLDLGVKVTRNVVQYPLHHVTYLGTKVEVAMSKGLGGDTFTRNVTDGRTDRRTTDRLWYENITFFLKKKAGITTQSTITLDKAAKSFLLPFTTSPNFRAMNVGYRNVFFFFFFFVDSTDNRKCSQMV